MRILVCVKRVPAPGAKINVTSDGQTVDTTSLGFTTSPHEECALEEAVQIADRTGGEVTVVTLGPVEAEEQLRYAASVGGHQLLLIPTNGLAWDPQRTAAALTESIQQLETEHGAPFDLVMFGNESADSGGFQVGIRVANALDRPMVNGIKGISVGADDSDVDFNDDEILARREIDGGSEVYRLPLPAVLGVKEGINLPRYPTMKGRLASKKVDLLTADIDADEGGQAMLKLHRPEETMSETVVLSGEGGDPDEAAVAVVDLLEELGLLT